MAGVVSRTVTSRRSLIAGGTSAAAGAALTIAGCGGSTNNAAPASPARAAAASSVPISGSPRAATASSPTAARTTPTPQAEVPKKGGTVTLGQVTDILLNKGFPWAIVGQNLLPTYTVMEPLVRYRSSLVPENVLVDQFEYSSDRTKLTLRLKQGLTFHNGAPVTVDDVFHGIDVMNDPTKFGITASFQLAVFAKFITDRKKVDQRTAEFTFDKPHYNMSDFFSQLMVTQASSYADLVAGKGVQGTGPFKWDAWAPGQSLRLKANPNWHLSSQEGGPYLDAVQLRIFADQDSLGLAFEGGDVDLVLGIGGSVAARFRDKKLTRLAPKTGLVYVGCVVTNPLLKDKRVRQALFLAIDRARIAHEVAEGFTEVTAQPWPQTSPAFDPMLQAAYYDPAKAKDLLKQAGFTQDKPLALEYIAPSLPSQAAIIKQNFEDIGVKINLMPEDGNAFTAKALGRQFTDLWATSHSFADLSPLTNFEQTLPYRIPNFSYFEDPAYVQFINDLEKVDPSSAAAKALYKTFNEGIWLDSAWLLPVQGNERIDLVSNKVRGISGYFVTISGDPDFGKIWKQS